MRFYWKVYFVLTVFLLAGAAVWSSVVAIGVYRRDLSELRDHQSTLAELAAANLQIGHRQQLWPVEVFLTLSQEKSFVGWQILDHLGSVRYSHRGFEVDFEPPPASATSHSSGLRQLIERRGGTQETAVVPLDLGNARGSWRFALTYDKRHVSERMGQLWLTFFILALAGFLLLLPLTSLVTRRFLSPLLALTRAVLQINQDPGSVQLPVPPRDEIGELIRAFADMVHSIRMRDARINHNLQLIQEARDELEARVERRTADLKARKTELETEIDVRQRAEEALREAELWLRTLIDNAPEAIVIFDPDLGRFVDVNDNATQLFGIDRDTLCAAGPIELSPLLQPDGRASAEVAKQLTELALTGATPVFEWSFADSEGAPLPCEVRLVSLWRRNRPMIRGSITDIRERKAAEARLKDLNQRLIESSRRAGMAEVASSVLHNVGNVLNSVTTSAAVARQSASQMSLDELSKVSELLSTHEGRLQDFFAEGAKGQLLPPFLAKLGSQLSRERKLILEHIELLNGHVDHIKQIVRMQQMHARAGCFVERVELREVIDNAISMTDAGLARHNVRVECQYHSEGIVTVDRHRVLQVLVNLLNNAKQSLDHVPSEIRRVMLVCEIDEQQQVVIEVSDNGKGIRADHLTKIFQHGFTTRKDGNGFGLHASALAATEMGGELLVRSEGAGKGASFTLRIPQQTTDVRPKESTTEPSPPVLDVPNAPVIPQDLSPDCNATA